MMWIKNDHYNVISVLIKKTYVKQLFQQTYNSLISPPNITLTSMSNISRYTGIPLALLSPGRMGTQIQKKKRPSEQNPIVVCAPSFLKPWGVSKVLIGWNKKGHFKVLIETFWLQLHVMLECNVVAEIEFSIHL